MPPPLSLRPSLVVRTSTRHWTMLSKLLDALEACMEFCARFDAYRDAEVDARGKSRVKRAHKTKRDGFDRRLQRLRRDIDREIDRVTAERLMIDVTYKMHRRAYFATYHEDVRKPLQQRQATVKIQPAVVHDAPVLGSYKPGADWSHDRDTVKVS